MSKKRTLSSDRFENPIPLYKRAAGIQEVEEPVKKPVKEKPVKTKVKTGEKKELELCSLRLSKAQIKALGLRHLETKENVSGMVREALNVYLADYLEDGTVKLQLPIQDDISSKSELESKGIRLDRRLIEAVRIVAASNGVSKSEIVRCAVNQFLLNKDAI